MIEKIFIKEGIKESEVEEFLSTKFDRAGYSHTEIQRTPLGTRIIVYAHKPGLIVGKSGRRIQEITEEIKEKFGFDNPLVDVKEIDNPFLDSNVVVKRIIKALEKGLHYKKVANYYLDRIIEAGAVGAQIKVAGKLAGEKARFQKFKKGLIAHSGDYADTLVSKGSSQAMLKPGIVGVEVKIMMKAPSEFTLLENVEEPKVTEEKKEKI